MKIQRNEQGASLVEHGIMLGLVAVVSIAAVSQLAFQVEDGFSKTTVVREERAVRDLFGAP